ncbi:MAG TPA: hypothetical protein PKE45_20390 [Caldilineaceae bacterium]|nr:hypothetical protein [Caldilineaceae bacterium]
MIAHSSSVDLEDQVEALHQILRHLNDPARLAESPWAGSTLVRQAQQRAPHLAVGQLVKLVLSEQLAVLAREHDHLADLLRGHFWEGLTVAEMVHAGRPTRQSERRFFEQQH